MYSIKNFIALIALVSFLELNSEDFDNYEKRTEVKDFIEKMHKKHKFDKEWLEEIFSDAKYQEKVVRIMNRQPEGVMTWSDYKGIMISQDRISSGSRFIQRYKQDLLRAEEIYGVPASIIAAIIGIETNYGENMGRTRVLDSLSTLSFDYPRREKFFKIQLEEFLLLSREEGFDPYKIKGSIAGAMGYGQFMPDSYRSYAVDFDFDGTSDLLNNPIDAIGSIANFLSKKGKWEPNVSVAVKAIKVGNTPEIKSSFKPYMFVSELDSFGLKPTYKLQKNTKVVPIELELEEGQEYWLGLKNYNALSRYNRSKLYVMAVFEFSKSLIKFF